MSTLYVLLASALAVAALIGLNAAMGGWSAAKIGSLDEAIARLRQDRPDFAAREGALGADGRGALVADASLDKVGLVLAQGDVTVTRFLTPLDVRAALASAEGDLVLLLDDFTLPKAVIALKDEAAARRWAARLSPTGAAPDAAADRAADAASPRNADA